MSDSGFEDKPLRKILAGMRPSEDRTLAEIRADLISKGYDPDAFSRRLEKRISELTRDSRLAWREIGEAKQKKANAVLAGIRSWAQRSASEIDRRFADVLAGRFGEPAQFKLKTAFKNFSELTSESKAAFLDEVDALMALRKEQGGDKNGKQRR